MSEILVSGLLIIGSILHATIKKLNLIKLGKTMKKLRKLLNGLFFANENINES